LVRRKAIIAKSWVLAEFIEARGQNDDLQPKRPQFGRDQLLHSLLVVWQARALHQAL
jgi:hypothetical protein